MQAAVITEWRKPLAIVDLSVPECPTTGVVLRVLACGVCRSDWHAWCGSDPDVNLPQIPGHEYCGIVEKPGTDVTRWRVGDRVIAPFILACGKCPSCSRGQQTTCANQVVPGFTQPGAFAEQIAIPFADENLARLPDGMDPALAASLGCRVTTAWHALTDRAALAPGEWLAVFGCGGVGLSAMLLGRAIGARVVVVDLLGKGPVGVLAVSARCCLKTGDRLRIPHMGIAMASPVEIARIWQHADGCLIPLRVANEVPTLLMIFIVIMVVVKPF